MRGGWDEYDHSTFLKWRVRNKVLFKTIEVLLRAIIMIVYKVILLVNLI